MSTYHCAIKVGTGGKTIPHLDYIQRTNKYAHKGDLICHSSGNIPTWAKDEKEFWTQCAIKDNNRSYREIEFALPNELPPEKQEKIVQEFIQEVIPNNPYTYAIHEVDSAVHGIKNPHVHLMFSERIIEGRSEEHNKDEFFNKRGRSKKGQEYGGTRKDRTWAGKGRTAKYYEVRKTVADLINEKYKEMNLPHRVDYRSLKEQSIENLLSGNIEKTPSNTERAVRIDEKIFRPMAHTIKEEVESKEEVNKELPIEIQDRILKERQRRMDLIALNLITKINKELEPSEANLNHAYHKTMEYVDALKMHFETPFNYFKKTLEKLNIYIPEGKESENEYTQAIANELEIQEQHDFFLSQVKDDPAQLIADLELNYTELKKEYNRLKNKKDEDIIADFLSANDKNVLQTLNQDLKNQRDLLFVAKETFSIDASNNKENLKEISNKLQTLTRKYRTPDLIATAKKMKRAAINRHTKSKPKTIEYYENQVINQTTGNKLKPVLEQIRSKESLLKYHVKQGHDTTLLRQEINLLKQEHATLRQIYLTADLKIKAIKLWQEQQLKYKNTKPYPINYYEKILLNKVSNGEYSKLITEQKKEVNRIQELLKNPEIKKTSTKNVEKLKKIKETLLHDIDRLYPGKLEEYKGKNQKTIKELDKAINKTEQLLILAKKTYPNVDTTKEKAKTISVKQKHEELKTKINDKANDEITALNKDVKTYTRYNKPIQYYEDILIDKECGGALKLQKEKLRSRESLLQYLSKEGKDTAKVQQEIETIKKDIQLIRDRYINPSIKEQAKKDHESILKKRNKINLKAVGSKLKKLLRKRHLTAPIRRSGTGLLNNVSQLFEAEKSSGLGAASFRVGKETDIEHMNQIR